MASDDGRRGMAVVGTFGGDLSGDLYSARRHIATGTTVTSYIRLHTAQSSRIEGKVKLRNYTQREL